MRNGGPSPLARRCLSTTAQDARCSCCVCFSLGCISPFAREDAGFIERTVKERGLEGTSQRPRAAAKPPLDVDFLKRNRRLVLFWNRANQGGGGAEEDRTPDPLRARQVLSQLSYGPHLVGLGGLEPPASPLSGVRSNQLSYRPLGDLLTGRLPKPNRSSSSALGAKGRVQRCKTESKDKAIRVGARFAHRAWIESPAGPRANERRSSWLRR